MRGGKRVRKDDPRVEAYGSLDELNSLLGTVLAALPQGTATPLGEELELVQHELFSLGAEVAGSGAANPPLRLLEARHVEALERSTDRFMEPVGPLRHFVLPRGTPLAAQLHVARTVARRAERALVRLDAAEPLRPVILAYVNRLSDLLFAMALWVNHEEGRPETAPDYTR